MFESPHRETYTLINVALLTTSMSSALKLKLIDGVFIGIAMTDPTDCSDQDDMQMSSPSVTIESSFPPGGGSRNTGSATAIVGGT